MTWRIVISGVGGQGVISAGIILAEAAVIEEDRYAVQSQSYGAEMRGGLSRTDVTISDTEVIYPKVDQAHALVCLHQKALGAYATTIRPGGLLITDEDVSVQRRIDSRQISLPCVSLAREVTGSDRNANMCMLGALIAITRVVSVESLIARVATRFAQSEPARAAITAGYELGQERAAHIKLMNETKDAGRHATSARL